MIEIVVGRGVVLSHHSHIASAVVLIPWMTVPAVRVHDLSFAVVVGVARLLLSVSVVCLGFAGRRGRRRRRCGSVDLRSTLDFLVLKTSQRAGSSTVSIVEVCWGYNAWSHCV